MSQFQPRMTYDALQKTAPNVIAALISLGKVVQDSGLPRELIELVDIRASQINGCAFCIQYHLNNARALGIPRYKLDLVAAWREAGVFSAREMAALAWTEELSRMASGANLDKAYAAARREFDEAEIVFLTAAIGTINHWNRMMGSFAIAPPIPKEGAGSAA